MAEQSNQFYNFLNKYFYFLLSVFYFAMSLIYYPVADFINKHFYNILICNFLKLTGFPCPLCGGSRSAFYFIQLEFEKSIYNNFAVFILSTFFVIMLFLSIYQIIFNKKKLIEINFIKIFIKFFIIFLLLQWIVKLFMRITL